MHGGAQYGLIISLDAQDSGTVPDPDRPALRERIYRAAEDAFGRAGLGRARLVQEDRGDGILTVVEPRRPEVVAGEWTEYLHQNLRHLNRGLARPLRLRAGLTVGVFTPDLKGISGAAVDLACRIGNCAEAKAVLAASPDAPLLVAVTDQLHQDVIRHGGRWIEPDHYRQYRVRLKEGEQRPWFTVPGRGAPPPASAAGDGVPTGEDPAPPSAEPAPPEAAGDTFRFGNVTAQDHAQVLQGSFRDITFDHRSGGSGAGGGA
ncbi:hypothetical protein AB0O72_23095 [Streptomyces sp. NPDC088106]|uniref:hypothetical protein n=1 Tax=Streptomyces sp. NPDC088106 TaxID=3154867 RepID=UPI00342FB92A